MTGAKRILLWFFAASAAMGCAALAGVGDYKDAPCDGVCVDAAPSAIDSGTPDACSTDLTTDPKSCGRCGHNCLGGQCKSGSCQPFVMVSQQDFVSPLVVSPSTLFFGNYRAYAIRSVELDSTCVGSACAPVAIGSAIVAQPSGPALANGYLYWSNAVDLPNQNIMRLSLDAGKPEVFASGQEWPVSTHARGAYLYWVNGQGPNWISRRGFAGGAVERLATGGTDTLSNALVVDDEYAYWNTTPDAIARTPLGGPGCSGDACRWIVVGNGPGGMAQDARFVYVAVFGSYGPSRDGTIVRIAKGCTGASCVETLVSAIFDPQAIALDETYLYWTDITEGTLRRVPLAPGSKCVGAACELLARDLGDVAGLSVDSTAIYISSESGPHRTPGQGTIWRLAK